MSSISNVKIIYSSPEEDYAFETVNYLEKNGFKKVSAESKGCIELETDQPIASDSAIVFLSNASIHDERWRANIEKLPDGYRMIPVRGKGTIECGDSDNVVKPLREINYIRPNENYYDNLQDALYTDPQFYEIKNEVGILEASWIMSGKEDAYLMADWKRARLYNKIFNKVYKREKNAAIKNNLCEQIDYLQLSSKRCLKLFLQDLGRNIKIISLIVLGIALLAALIFTRKRLKRAFYADALVGFDMKTQLPSIAAIKLSEGLTNPFVSDATKSRYYKDMIGLLDQNWENTPLGLGNYKWALNDAVLSDDRRYIYTSNGNGQVVRWDSYTGEIVNKENVSQFPLAAIGKSNVGIRFAVDSNGNLLASESESVWTDLQTKCDINFTTNVRIRVSANGDGVLVSDDTLCCYFEYSGRLLKKIWEKSFDRVLGTEIDEKGIPILLIKEGKTDSVTQRIYALLIEEGREKNIDFPTELNESCVVDICGDNILFSDKQNQLLIWDVTEDKMEKTSVILSMPIALALSEKGYLVYHDRNAGTQVFDMKRKIVMGDCFGFRNNVTRIELQNDILMVYAGGMIYTEDLNALFPVEMIPDHIIHDYSGIADSYSGKIVNSISVENEYIIKVVLNLSKETTVIIDGSSRYFIGEAEKDESLLKGIPENYSYYTTLEVNYTGKPTMVGIVPGEDVVLIGAYDGSFYEVAFSETGDALIASETVIPSHLSIVGVHQTERKYYLEDSAGNLWEKRIGYPAAKDNYGRLLDEVKDKLHMGVFDEVFDLVSDEVAKKLELHHLSIPDEMEWE